MKTIAILSSALMLAGCMNGVQIAYKPNDPWVRTNEAINYCSSEAIRIYPVAIQTRSGGGYSTPAYTNCTTGYNGAVNCTTTGGSYVAPYSYQVDANSTRRDSAYKACLASRGYELKTIKHCTGDVISLLQKLKANYPSTQGQLSASSCAIVEGNQVVISY